MTFREELIKLHACQESVDWVGERTLEIAWNECERADWMLWLAGKHVGETGWLNENDLRYVEGTVTLDEMLAASEASGAASWAANQKLLADSIRVRWPKVGAQ